MLSEVSSLSPATTLPPETGVMNADYVAAGLDKLAAIKGVDAVRLASIQLNAGGQCVGRLAEFIGVPKHAEVADGVVKAVSEAQQTGSDPEEAVASLFPLFVRRGEDGRLLGSGIEQLRTLHAARTEAAREPAQVSADKKK